MAALDLTTLETSALTGAMTGELHHATHYDGCEGKHWRCAVIALVRRVRYLEALLERDHVSLLVKATMPGGILYCTSCGAKATTGPVPHKPDCVLIGLLDEPEPEPRPPEYVPSGIPPRYKD